MNKCFSKNTPALYFATPSTKIMVLGVIAIFFYTLFSLVEAGIRRFADTMSLDLSIINSYIENLCKIFLLVGITLFIISIVVGIFTTDAMKIAVRVKKKMGCYKYGNPLSLKEGELLPQIKCKKTGLGIYELSISAITNTVEEIQEISSSISSSLNRKYKKYAVTVTSTDVAFNEVTFKIEDVAVDRTLYITSVEQLKQKDERMKEYSVKI